MSTEIATTNNLDNLAARIRSEHLAAKLAARKTLEHAIQAGELLLEAKRLVGHGHWGDWLLDHCDVSERTAQGYMRLARNQAALASNPQSPALLTIDQALEALAKPNERADRAIVSAAAEYLPAEGRGRLGVLLPRGAKIYDDVALSLMEFGGEVFGVMECVGHSGFFHVGHQEFFPDDAGGGVHTWTTKPMRGDHIGTWLEDAMRRPNRLGQIEWQDERRNTVEVVAYPNYPGARTRWSFQCSCRA
jgi:Protein of unknown function (DUF3102)